MKHVILPGLTTLTDWQSKIEEIDILQIKEMALFLTGLKEVERKELYLKLEKTKLKTIPHVHLREDMRSDEINYLIKKYKVKYFNIHPQPYFLPLLKLKKYHNQIYIENLKSIDHGFYYYLEHSAGLCLDFAHWEDFGVRLHNHGYKEFDQIVNKYKIGCCHVSAVKNKIGIDSFSQMKCYSRHVFKNLQEFDYLKKYKKYLPKYVSLELENSLGEQLIAAKYIKERII